MEQVKLYLLGAPRLEYAGQPVPIDRRKALALAAYLGLSDLAQSRDTVAALFWPELDQERARASLRATLPALNRAMPDPWLEADRAALRLLHDRVQVDVRRFIDLVKQGQAEKAETLSEAAYNALREAVALYHADFLEGFSLPDCPEFESWMTIQREWLQRELGAALRRLAQHESGGGDAEAALDHARRWLALDPLHEPAHRLLMRLYAAHGQRADALRQYQQCADLLDSELLTPPEDETTDLYNRILNNQLGRKTEDTALAPVASAGVLPPLPALVVGREAVLTEIKRRLGIGGEPRPTTLIQGWPGVGKSTTVAALAHDAGVGQHFPDGVLWTSLGETPNLLMALSAWAEVYHLVEPGRPARLEELSSQLTATLRDKRVLLIVDDIWQAEHALPFRVGGAACALVMTTRLNDMATALAPTAADIYRLPVLAEAAALELLGKLTPEAVRDYPEPSLQLVRDLEGLPLAINVAGRLLHNEARLGWGVGNLLEELRGASLLQAQAPSDMTGAGRDTSPTVAALLRRSTDALDALSRERFALLSLFVPKPATFDLGAMAVAWDTDDPRPTARALMNRGLMEPVSGGRFQMHALLVLHATSLLQEMVTA
jgi:DNA-binding SARP family transcriptional activator